MEIIKKKIRPFLLGLIIPAILIFTAWIVLPSVITATLSDYVKEKSGGTYTLTIEGLDIEMAPLTLTFSRVNLIPSKQDSSLSVNENKTTRYTFSSSKIELNKISTASLIRNKEIECSLMKISEPSIILKGRNLLQQDSLQITSVLISDVAPLFDHIKKISVKKIELEEADFSFYSDIGDSSFISRADHVSVDLLGFRTGRSIIRHHDRYFETDDVIIRMNDFKNDMGDSLHILTIDTLTYSLKTTDIRAWGFKLNPLYRTPAKNFFEVNVPEVYVKSRSIAHFALNDSLKIRYLTFKDPDIKFYQKENYNRLDIEDINNFDLYKLVQNNFIKMAVDTFMLYGAKLEIYRQPDNKNYQQQFKSIDINLRGFELDSTSARDPEKMFHADNLEMQVAGYHLRLEDNQHDFRADSLFVSTFTNKLGVKKINIKPSAHGRINSRTEADIDCEALNIENANLLNLYHKRILPVSKIEILNPDVHLKYHLDIKKPEGSNEAGLLFEMVTDYLLGVYSDLVYLEAGKLNIQNLYDEKIQGYFETDFNFSLTDFTLDSTSVKRTDKLFYATTFDLYFSDYGMKLIDGLHKLDVQRLSISSTNQCVQIENLKLHPVRDNVDYDTMQKFNRSELFNISVPLIDLNGVNLRNAFFHKKLNIRQFEISGPQIYFENFGTLRAAKDKIKLTEFYQLIFNYIEDFDIESFSALNGKLTWINHTRKGKTISFDNEFSASLNNFRLNEEELNKQRLLFSDSFNLTINDQQFELSDAVHVLKANEINLSSAKSQLVIKDALLYPLITSEEYSRLPATFQVSIPEIIISDINYHEVYYNQKAIFDKLELLSPRIEVYRQKNKIKSLNLNRYKLPLPEVIDSLKLGQLEINDGKVITYDIQGTDHKASANFNFDLFLPSVAIRPGASPRDRLSGDNILLDMHDFKVPLGNDHNLSIEEIHFNRNLKKISVIKLKAEPFMPSGEINYFNIYFPEIKFTAFDLEKAIEENKFNFNDIVVASPDIDIKINKRLNGDTLKFLQTLDLYPYIEPLAEQIKINDLHFNDVNLNFNWLQKQLFSNNLNLDFKDIFIAKNQPPANLLNSREFEISTTNLSETGKNGLYKFTADSLKYNSARHDVLFTNLGISPLTDKEKFTQRDGYQTDVVDAVISYVALKGINEKRWLQNNILEAVLIEIGPSNLNIYRNKRYPLDPHQRPPWPQDLLKQIKQPFIFDSLHLMPSQVKYSELLGIRDEPGVVIFEDLTLKGNELSNMQNIIKRDNHLIINASTSLFDKSLLSARFNFDLSSPDYAHTVKGSLEPMNLEPVNLMLSKAEPLSVESGYLKKLEFDISADDDSSKLLMKINYNDLKITLHEYGNHGKQKSGFATFWANNFMINSDYPKGNSPQSISRNYNRDEQRSIINYWWKTLYSGIKEALGLQSGNRR